jgi:hypothetical protein
VALRIHPLRLPSLSLYGWLRLSLAAAWLLFDALPGPGVVTAAQALAALCEAHRLDREARGSKAG